MNQVYSELGALITAIGTPWFCNTLPAALQCAFNYDYLLLARYRKTHPLQIVRSDFQGVEMQRTLHFLVTETYVAEPIYRLFNANRTKGGIFDMADLTRESQSLPEPLDYSLPHLIPDNSEEIGWRTLGWPEYQHETCILVPLAKDELISVSLFNFGLVSSEASSREELDQIYPLLTSIIARHFSLQERPEPAQAQIHGAEKVDHSADNSLSGITEVTGFFESQFDITITPRETEVFTPLLQGDTLSAIADKLCISVYTARTHRRNVYRKIGHGRLLELINQFHSYTSSNKGK